MQGENIAAMGDSEEEQRKNGFKIPLRDVLLTIAGTALALGSFKSDDPMVVIPMLVLSGIAFVWLCLGHQGQWVWKIAAAVCTVGILCFIGWRDLRHASVEGPSISQPDQSKAQQSTAQEKAPPQEQQRALNRRMRGMAEPKGIQHKKTEPAPTVSTSGPNSPTVGSISQGAGSALSIGQQGGVTAGTYVSDVFPRPGVVPNVTMCVTEDGRNKKTVIITTDTEISSPYWWFALDGPASDSSIEMLHVKEPYGSTHGPATQEQANRVNLPSEQLIGFSITEIGNPFGGPFRPFSPADVIRVTITFSSPAHITHVETGHLREHMEENVIFACRN